MLDYLRYVAGVAMVIVGVYWCVIGNLDDGISMILAGLALLGIILTGDKVVKSLELQRVILEKLTSKKA